MSTIRFSLRENRSDKVGACPVLMLYQIQGERATFTTSIAVRPENWSKNDQIVVYINPTTYPDKAIRLHLASKKDCQLMNDCLNDIKKSIRTIELAFERDRKVYTTNDVLDLLRQELNIKPKSEAKSNKPKDILELLVQYIENFEKVRRPGSLTVYKTLLKDLRQYGKKKDISFSAFDKSFFESYENYLLSQTKIVAGVEQPRRFDATISKQLTTLKAILSYAKDHGYPINDGYKRAKIKHPQKDVLALTNDEFEKLWSWDFTSNPRLDKVRDVFCFACATGLRISDLKQLRWHHISLEKGLIQLTDIVKTKESLIIPLNNKSKAILSKYQGNDIPLPLYSDQKLNLWIKETCKIAGIDETKESVRRHGGKRIAHTNPKYERISMHTARKTFITLSLEKGMAAEVVMATSGHKEHKSFMRYVAITEERKREAMITAWG